MNKITIVGYESECNCEHCGRNLVHGIKTSEGVIGSQCFVKQVADTKMSANTIIGFAKLVEKYSAETLASVHNIYGYMLSFNHK